MNNKIDKLQPILLMYEKSINSFINEWEKINSNFLRMFNLDKLNLKNHHENKQETKLLN